ncbi:hypothetical protein NEDG_00841 [Nematocida displodere]|uniref:Uncharacterized protein n=1 Tax=Nematocida displodere TaxID=1805483 RepID=A0A177ED07_9MICR|nr:hypothetical protein NEDG_00841 [Nematocida displodere]
MGTSNINAKKDWHPSSARTRAQISSAKRLKPEVVSSPPATNLVPLEAVVSPGQRMGWMIG